MITIPRNIPAVWNYLGDAWGDFEGQDAIEGVWAGVAAGIDKLFDLTMTVQNSRSMPFMSPTVDRGPLQFIMVVSGLESAINVDELSNGQFSFRLPDWTYSIPTLTQSYTVGGISYSGLYTQGVDYTISGLNTLIWIGSTPQWDKRYSGKGVLSVMAQQVLTINPVLAGVWARVVGIDINNFYDYNIFNAESFDKRYRHLKYFIWALFYKRLQAPTIKNMSDLLSIARGAPFAYNSGIVNSVLSGNHYNVTVGPDSFVFPSGLIPVPNGWANQFDILASGIQVVDYHDNAALINQYSPELAKYNTIVLTNKHQLSFLSYDTDFYSHIRLDSLPKQFNFIDVTIS